MHLSCAFISLSSLSLQSSAIEQVLYILMDILSWEIPEVVSPCLPHGLWSHIVIRVFLLLGNVCPYRPPYPVLPSCPLSRAFPYPQPGDAGGCHSAPAVCQSLTSADPLNECSSYCASVMLMCDWQTSDVGLTETVGDGGDAFELWFRKRLPGSTFTLRSSAVQVRRDWVHDISCLLWKQALHNRAVRRAELMCELPVTRDVRPPSLMSLGSTDSMISTASLDFKGLSQTVLIE